jgi:hypothetical protein
MSRIDTTKFGDLSACLDSVQEALGRGEDIESAIESEGRAVQRSMNEIRGDFEEVDEEDCIQAVRQWWDAALDTLIQDWAERLNPYYSVLYGTDDVCVWDDEDMFDSDENNNHMIGRHVIPAWLAKELLACDIISAVG